MASDFHEVRFPLDVSLGSRGGPVRRTDIVTLASGREHRNSRWAQLAPPLRCRARHPHARCAARVIAFFEERRGRLYGFRFRDRIDWRSGPPSREPTPLDQRIGTGDGQSRSFPLVQAYGVVHRALRSGRSSSPSAARCGSPSTASSRLWARGFNCDPATGLVTFAAAPPGGAVITAGFAFDVPVRFDTDELDIDLSAFDAGEHPADPADRDRSLDTAMSSRRPQAGKGIHSHARRYGFPSPCFAPAGNDTLTVIPGPRKRSPDP